MLTATVSKTEKYSVVIYVKRMGRTIYMRFKEFIKLKQGNWEMSQLYKTD